MTAPVPPTPNEVMRRLQDTVDLGRLPPPPASGPAWRDRVARLERDLPGIGAHVANAPIG